MVGKPAPTKASQTGQHAAAAAGSSGGPTSNGSSTTGAAPAAGGSALASLLCRPAETTPKPGRSGSATDGWQECKTMQRAHIDLIWGCQVSHTHQIPAHKAYCCARPVQTGPMHAVQDNTLSIQHQIKKAFLSLLQLPKRFVSTRLRLTMQSGWRGASPLAQEHPHHPFPGGRGRVLAPSYQHWKSRLKDQQHLTMQDQ